MEDGPIKEIHAARLKLQDETAGMTVQEKCDYLNNKARETLARHGITPPAWHHPPILPRTASIRPPCPQQAPEPRAAALNKSGAPRAGYQVTRHTSMNS
ncbi:hypothetical protein LQZ19_06645 [Treponema primitia]|uniref:hypothetical protein n=1 Tax=Treponema primitia TaxID=88058 RepID=UPI003981795D